MCDECAWESALERIAEGQALLEEITAEAAADFVESVSEKLDNIAEWIQEKEHVTPAQEEAIENMIAGAEKWVRD